MKTQKVKVKFKELHSGQKVFITDGTHIYPMTVLRKSMDSTEYKSLHIIGTGEIKLPYSDSKIETLQGDRAIGVLNSLGITVPVSDEDKVCLVSHVQYIPAVDFTTRIRRTEDKVKIKLHRDIFNQENTKLRIFKKMKHAVNFCKLNLVETDIDGMDDLLLGYSDDILRFTPDI
ncbi:hypothetical protein TSMG0007 [Halocynthia phage JM-2012]|uniref:hypothetical protein n=1 Tax=Halocynthia phage JM-2012 TaxID=1173297 RepID=UPI00025C68D6|nr:hypothetical protein TSMG0007 [Halocynthia phage JM-2012]AFI55290.1 hypothetical protein TSMG0007 [Halocynthia phage JM-2012]